MSRQQMLNLYQRQIDAGGMASGGAEIGGIFTPESRAGLADYRLWHQEYKMQHPAAGREELKEAWRLHKMGVSGMGRPSKGLRHCTLESLHPSGLRRCSRMAPGPAPLRRRAAGSALLGGAELGGVITAKTRAGLANYRMWHEEYKLQHPAAGREELKEAWRLHKMGGGALRRPRALPGSRPLRSSRRMPSSASRARLGAPGSGSVLQQLRKGLAARAAASPSLAELERLEAHRDAALMKAKEFAKASKMAEKEAAHIGSSLRMAY